MRLIPKSWTHWKDFDRLPNGAKKCVCGHGSNEHYHGECFASGCHCQNGLYFFYWRKK